MKDTATTKRKYLNALKASTLRELINSTNNEGISKSDIVTVFRDEHFYILLYYK